MKRECSSGFTLVELLLALTIGLVVGAAVIQALLATTALTSKMARQLTLPWVLRQCKAW